MKASTPKTMKQLASVTDIASIGHWESLWGQTTRIHDFSQLNYYDHRIAKVFKRFANRESRVLELGCGGSRWIGFFARNIGCEVWGIDYSPEGIRITETANSGESRVRLVKGDVFDRCLLPLNSFDFIYSLGFVEHFLETVTVTARIAELLAPGGRVMTLVPNFCGPYGKLQRWVEPEVFSKHIVLDGPALDRVHVAAGLRTVMKGDFWGCFGPGVVDYGSRQKLILPPLKILQHTICWLLAGIRMDIDWPVTSPYIVGVYEKVA